MKSLLRRAAPSVTAVGLMLLPFGAQAASAPKSLEARLQESLGGASVVHLFAVSSPADEGSAAQLLSSSLPSGVTLKSASDAQVTEAVKAAVARDPKMAASIVRVAIITKVPAGERNAAPRKIRRRVRSHNDGKSISQNASTFNPWAKAGVSAAQPRVFIAVVTDDPEGFIAAVVAAAIAAAPDQAAAIVAAAVGVAPAYAVTITQSVLAALPSSFDNETRRGIIAAAQLAAPDQSTALGQLGQTGGSGGSSLLTSGGLGASSLAPAAQGAGVVNPANIGAGAEDVSTNSVTANTP